MSLGLAVVYGGAALAVTVGSAVFIARNFQTIKEKPETLAKYSCFYCEAKFDNEVAHYIVVLFLVRRMLLTFSLVTFHKSANAQIVV